VACHPFRATTFFTVSSLSNPVNVMTEKGAIFLGIEGLVQRVGAEHGTQIAQTGPVWGPYRA
jgi:hypothetical protein